ncbi:MAG: Ig-like domain-containing protein [Armatimonadota bacterium]
MRMFYNGRIIIGLGVLSVVALLAGCGGGGRTSGLGGASDGNAPAITSTSATSPKTSAGGPVTIKSTATDDIGVTSVTAVVTKPDGSNSVAFTMNAGANNTYTYNYDAPQNYTPLDQTYSVTVTARDSAGNTATSSAFTFLVPRDGPPDPPT